MSEQSTYMKPIPYGRIFSSSEDAGRRSVQKRNGTSTTAKNITHPIGVAAPESSPAYCDTSIKGTADTVSPTGPRPFFAMNTNAFNAKDVATPPMARSVMCQRDDCSTARSESGVEKANTCLVSE